MIDRKYSFLLRMIFITIFLTSCSFHLRGSQDLSAVLPEATIQGVEKQSELGRALSAALLAANVNVLDESDTVFEIVRNDFAKRVLSVENAGRANQYEISYQVAFKLTRRIQEKDKKLLFDLVPEQVISAKREYLYDSALVLAKADEENSLKKDMLQAVMSQLVRRLLFSLKTKNKPDVQTKVQLETRIESTNK